MQEFFDNVRAFGFSEQAVILISELRWRSLGFKRSHNGFGTLPYSGLTSDYLSVLRD